MTSCALNPKHQLTRRPSGVVYELYLKRKQRVKTNEKPGQHLERGRDKHLILFCSFNPLHMPSHNAESSTCEMSWGCQFYPSLSVKACYSVIFNHLKKKAIMLQDILNSKTSCPVILTQLLSMTSFNYPLPLPSLIQDSPLHLFRGTRNMTQGSKASGWFWPYPRSQKQCLHTKNTTQS